MATTEKFDLDRAALDALNLLRADAVRRIAAAASTFEVVGTVCGACLLSPQDADTAWWIDEVAFVTEADRVRATNGLEGIERSVAAWGLHLADLDDFFSFGGSPSAEFDAASDVVFAALSKLTEDDPMFSPYQFVLDAIAEAVTRDQLWPFEVSPDFVAHPDYDGDFPRWLPLSLRRICDDNTLELLASKDLLPPLWEGR